MKRIFLIITLILNATLIFGQVNFGTKEDVSPYVFGVRIIPTNYGVGQFYVLTIQQGKIVRSNAISKDSFIKQALGKEKSDANPENENLFLKYEITNLKTVDNLWKLRYATYPFATSTGDTLGWTANFANPYMPTEAQQEILKEFNFTQINGYLYGSNLFILMKKTEDPNWLTKYTNAGKDNTNDN